MTSRLRSYRMTPDPESSVYIGTMSGTSMDGLDIVAVSFKNNESPQILAQRQVNYPEDLRHQLQCMAVDMDATVSQMSQLDTRLGQFYAEQINHFISDYQLLKNDIMAVGSHGQTIRHSIQSRYPFSLQIGDPNIIAALTNLVVVADFRRRDLALGGEGAPLAPAFHNYAFRSRDCNRVIINIGGIANITCLPSNPAEPIAGFDTGPGNTLMDYLSQQVLGANFDENGDFARTGQVLTDQLQTIIQQEPFFHRDSPKSTGTDYFSPQWLKRTGLLDVNPADAMATLVELDCLTVSEAINSLPLDIHECYVCGGGAQNLYLMQRLACHLGDRKLETTATLGLDPDWVEAVAFAWLARQTLRQQPGNLPSVTNAEKFTILGAVYY